MGLYQAPSFHCSDETIQINYQSATRRQRSVGEVKHQQRWEASPYFGQEEQGWTVRCKCGEDIKRPTKAALATAWVLHQQTKKTKFRKLY